MSNILVTQQNTYTQSQFIHTCIESLPLCMDVQYLLHEFLVSDADHVVACLLRYNTDTAQRLICRNPCWLQWISRTDFPLEQLFGRHPSWATWILPRAVQFQYLHYVVARRLLWTSMQNDWWDCFWTLLQIGFACPHIIRAELLGYPAARPIYIETLLHCLQQPNSIPMNPNRILRPTTIHTLQWTHGQWKACIEQWLQRNVENGYVNTLQWMVDQHQIPVSGSQCFELLRRAAFHTQLESFRYLIVRFRPLLYTFSCEMRHQLVQLFTCYNCTDMLIDWYYLEIEEDVVDFLRRVLRIATFWGNIPSIEFAMSRLAASKVLPKSMCTLPTSFALGIQVLCIYARYQIFDPLYILQWACTIENIDVIRIVGPIVSIECIQNFRFSAEQRGLARVVHVLQTILENSIHPLSTQMQHIHQEMYANAQRALYTYLSNQRNVLV